MSLEHADVAEWHAAYLIDALSPVDRRAFEEHLESCERCVRAIAEVTPTLGPARAGRSGACQVARGARIA